MNTYYTEYLYVMCITVSPVFLYSVLCFITQIKPYKAESVYLCGFIKHTLYSVRIHHLLLLNSISLKYPETIIQKHNLFAQ